MANRLQFAKSPYLQQHAANPVDWFPWEEAAFEQAQRENKPVFLSIGYATCHWCHVMAKESFSNPEIAAILNRYFIAIKVDKEERPDLDQIYMNVCQALTGSGGWPLNLILTPQKQAFWAGTYFPPFSSPERPGLADILTQIGQSWQKNPAELKNSAHSIQSALKQYFQTSWSGKWSKNCSQEAFQAFCQSFDKQYGGFGSAPKFPMPAILSFLLRYHFRTGEPLALEMVETTLQKMYSGGIYDQLGFGFARYSTDRQWLVPHFEKMLYDNAQLTSISLEAYQITQNPFYAQIAQEILTWLRQEMLAPEGAFYAALDADSEGQEGLYYLWTAEEIEQVLGWERCKKWKQVYGLKKQILIRLNLHQNCPAERQDLFRHRQKRVKPALDRQILTGWNCLAITALAQAARILDQPEYYHMAQQALEFILTRLVNTQGRLLTRFCQDEAAYPACLDDYANLVQALLAMYSADFDPKWLKQAVFWQKEQDRLFLDQDNYFFTGSDSEALPFRSKEFVDGATPAGNSVAALNLLHLGQLTGNPSYQEQAERLLNSLAQILNHNSPFLLQAAELLLSARQELSIVAEQPLPPELLKAFLPNLALLVKKPGLEEMAPFTAEMTSHNKQTTYYLCQNQSCQEPITDWPALKTSLQLQ